MHTTESVENPCTQGFIGASQPMSLQRACSAEEYVEWIKQAVFEVEDLRDCFEYEMDELGQIPAFLDPLERSIRELYQSMVDNEYHFGREDLPFIPLINKHPDEIPFAVLLRQINETHRNGIDIDANDQ
jgi:hypothetical protein